MAVTEYTVTGMSCANCERHIREELEHLDADLAIAIDHRDGRLSITTEGAPVGDDAVFAAVGEAGYAAQRV